MIKTKMEEHSNRFTTLVEKAMQELGENPSQQMHILLRRAVAKLISYKVVCQISPCSTEGIEMDMAKTFNDIEDQILAEILVKENVV